VNGYGACASFVLSQMKSQITVTAAPFPEVQSVLLNEKKPASVIDLK